jgi:hypothetical protein
MKQSPIDPNRYQDVSHEAYTMTMVGSHASAVRDRDRNSNRSSTNRSHDTNRSVGTKAFLRRLKE